jgi:hypothetical protein
MKRTTVNLDGAADEAADELATEFGSRSAACRRALVFAFEQAQAHGTEKIANAGPYDGVSDDGRRVANPQSGANGPTSGDVDHSQNSEGRMSGTAPAPGEPADVDRKEGTPGGVESDAKGGPSSRERGRRSGDGSRGGVLDTPLFGGLLGGDEE